MNFNTYEDYIDSNIEWFSSVPKHWNLIKIKHLINYYTNGAWGKEKQNDINDIICIRIADFNYPQRNVKDIDFTIRNIPLNNKLLLKPGDLLIEKSGGGEKQPVGRVVLFDKDIKATFSNFISKLKIKSEYNSNYLCYVFNMLYSSRVNTKSIKQTTGIQNLDSYAYFDEIIAIPQINEQKQIANYLDQKTAKIDATIAKNEELIQLLEEKRVALINQTVTKGLNPDVPMKYSGVEWISEIPEHWKVEKIKNISQVKPSNVDKKSKDNEPPVLLCNYTDVYNNEFITMDLDFMKATATHDQIRKLSLNVGDIIITKDSEAADDIAVPAIVTEELENVVCGYHLAVITPNSNIVYPKFLFRSFESDRINKQFELGANGVTRFGLGSYPINNAYVCQPPLNEQKEIANYLDIETAKIFKATDKILKHIALLEEYKTSLIHHVVTGKIDVRGEEI